MAIVHLRREASINRPMVLQKERLAKLWSDPMLRYSSIMDGLFHDKVVLCEGEPDCRFYHAAFDYLWANCQQGGAAKPNVLFIDVGGKRLSKKPQVFATRYWNGS